MSSHSHVPSTESLLLKITGVSKSFPGVQALQTADFDLRAGEIHALVGENGAGKSTLIKVLTGVHERDTGEIHLHGRPVRFQTPLEAQKAGIAPIYQEFTLVPSLTVTENIFLGNEITKSGIIDKRSESIKAHELLLRLGVDIDIDARVAELTVAQQQVVEIARALLRDASIIVMDEPTAALSPQEVSHLSQLLKELTAKGIGIIFISHRLDEILALSDRITVMRDGKTITTRNASAFSRKEMIEQMVGRSIEQEYFKEPVSIGEVCFDVRNLRGGMIQDVSFQLHRGEILGIGGLMGSGRTEIIRLIFGADKRESGTVTLNSKSLDINSPHDAINEGICLLTEDRKAQGLVLGASVKDNFALPNLDSWSQYSWIDTKTENERFQEKVTSLHIRLAHERQKAEELSGGNQQKLLIARWLETDSKVIMFDEPTRGIDVGAKYEMYQIIGQLASAGKAIIVVSSELPELLGICDRILVVKAGRITGEIQDVSEATQEAVMALAV